METENKYGQTRRPMGSISRMFQAGSGVFLIFFLGVHLFVAHIDFGHPVQFFNQVIQNLRNPWWLLFFIVFVWIITYHALNGVGNIVKDTSIGAKGMGYLNIALIVIYFATCIYGTILSIVVAGMAI